MMNICEGAKNPTLIPTLRKGEREKGRKGERRGGLIYQALIKSLFIYKIDRIFDLRLEIGDWRLEI
jgi:hypothetical protein